MTSRASKLLLLGLDGVTFDMLDPAFEAGRMPHLSKLLGRGVSGRLTSTVPPYTPPGWTSIFTGVNPGRHGIFGFTLGNAQRNEGLVRLDRVTAPALWNVVNAQGAPIGVFNVPMTYPAPPVDGFAVSGMLTPEGGGASPTSDFTHPAALSKDLVERLGRYEIDIEVSYEDDWRNTAIVDRLSENSALKRRALEMLLADHGDVPVLFAVLEAPDRLMHAHYKRIDPRCEHYDHPESGPIRERIWDFFDELDEVIGDLLAWAGDDGYVVTMSDHGFGPKDKGFNVNLALKQWGLLNVGGAGTLAQGAGVRKVGRKVKKLMPKAMVKKVKGAAHASIDWSKTKAFSAPIPQQGIYVNLVGREPHGIVSESEYEQVRDEIIERMMELKDPDDGKPVVDKVLKREEVMWGPNAAGAPDLFPVCREYAYELSDGLFSADILSDYRALPRGFHHMDGIFGLAGPKIGDRPDERAHLYDVLPTALYLGDFKIPSGLDGKVLAGMLPGLATARAPVVEDMDLPNAGEGAEASPYSAEDEAAIEESLRNLGYL